MLIAALLGAVFSGGLGAQVVVPPALFVDGEDEKREALGLAAVEVEVRIFGYLAETSMTMTFANPHGRALAGDLYFPLPEGTAVSGYALDVQGKMVDGVVVEKGEGRQVFEKIVRQGIDPGLVEWVKGNNFKTRVFPIPARGSRTVRVQYAGELVQGSEGTLYQLPLNFAQPVGRFSLRVEVVEATVAPQVRQGGLANFHFDQWRDSFVAETQMEDAPLTEDLIVALPGVDRQRVLVEEDGDGTVRFAISDLPPAPHLPEPKPPQRVAVLWDASGSRGRGDHGRELELLRKYFARFAEREIRVDLILFRNAAEKTRNFRIEKGNCEALIGALEQVAYDGGTQMGTIAPPADSAAPDLYLLFTDGLSNFGAGEPGEFHRPLYILSADAQTDHAFLRHLATRSGGAYFNLQRMEDETVLAGIGQSAYSFIEVETDGAEIAEVFPRLQQPVHGRFSLAGRLVADEGKIAIAYGVGGRVIHRSRYRISRKDAAKGDLVRRFWAQKKVDELSLFPQRHQDELVALGKRHGLVTPGTSLIVLENLDQYVEHRIPPPESLPEMRRQYREIVAQRDREKEQKKEDKLQYVLALWEKRVEWWKTEFEYPENFKYPEKDGVGDDGEPVESDEVEGAGQGLPGRRMSSLFAGSDRAAREQAAESPAPGATREIEWGNAMPVSMSEEMAAAGARAGAAKSAGSGDASRGSEPAIAIAPWNPDTPYLKALRQAAPAERFAAYMEQRREYGDAPSFFLDCANFFSEEGEESLSLQVLSNVAELELENAALLRVLAHRLAQLGRLDLSIGLFEEVLTLRPEEPQSHRDLALVLARRAAVSSETAREDYGRAIGLLYEVVMRQWDRFEEIEAIALMEINRLIPLARKAGVEAIPVDPRLVALLDVDVRIVLTWDADMTDMDLWVIEPSGEKAFYSHPLTTIGGRMSRDFTNGYGPEEYCVRKAQRGEYKIQANYYGSGAPTLSGAVTLQAEVFTNYGRADEKREAITVRLTGRKDTVEIGVVEF